MPSGAVVGRWVFRTGNLAYILASFTSWRAAQSRQPPGTSLYALSGVVFLAGGLLNELGLGLDEEGVSCWVAAALLLVATASVRVHAQFMRLEVAASGDACNEGPVGERVSRGHVDLEPALLRLGPAGWHGVATDRYGQVPAGTRMPPGLVLTDPGGENGLGVSGAAELELVAAGRREGRYRYHPLDADGTVMEYPYLYFFAEDGSWNLRAESGTASGGTIGTTTGGALPDARGTWAPYYGALREPHPVILRHTPAYTMPEGGWRSHRTAQQPPPAWAP